MDPIIGSALISAGSSILGGLFGSSAAEKQAAQQKEFAQNGIRWRVKDAEAAGIHPLYALGAQVTPYSPVPVGDYGISAAGQDLSRAYMATRTEGEKVNEFTQASQALQLEGMAKQNKLLDLQILRAQQPGQVSFPGSTMSMPGQGNSALVVDKPMERTVGVAGGTTEPGTVNDVSYIKTQSGWAVAPSLDAKQRIEDMTIPELQWSARNSFVPSHPPPKEVVGYELDPKFQEWVFNPIAGEWQVRFTSSFLRSRRPPARYENRGNRGWY